MRSLGHFKTIFILKLERAFLIDILEIKGIHAISSAGISNVNINFSKDQEREADYYSLETLKKLNTDAAKTL